MPSVRDWPPLKCSGARTGENMGQHIGPHPIFLGDLHAFVNSRSGIPIDIEERNSGDVVACVRENRTDIGIFAELTPAEGLKVFSYRDQHLGLVVPKGQPLARIKRVTFSEALDYDFVSLSEATSLTERLYAEGRRLQKTLKLHIQVRCFDFVCSMVAAGMGIGVLPLPLQVKRLGFGDSVPA